MPESGAFDDAARSFNARSRSADSAASEATLTNGSGVSRSSSGQAARSNIQAGTSSQRSASRTAPECSGKQRHPPCRSSHEHKPGGRTKDDTGIAPRVERSCGRSQALLYNRPSPFGHRLPQSDPDGAKGSLTLSTFLGGDQMRLSFARVEVARSRGQGDGAGRPVPCPSPDAVDLQENRYPRDTGTGGTGDAHDDARRVVVDAMSAMLRWCGKATRASRAVASR